jgi:hypothetical protein
MRFCYREHGLHRELNQCCSCARGSHRHSRAGQVPAEAAKKKGSRPQTTDELFTFLGRAHPRSDVDLGKALVLGKAQVSGAGSRVRPSEPAG